MQTRCELAQLQRISNYKHALYIADVQYIAYEIIYNEYIVRVYIDWKCDSGLNLFSIIFRYIDLKIRAYFFFVVGICPHTTLILAINLGHTIFKC